MHAVGRIQGSRTYFRFPDHNEVRYGSSLPQPGDTFVSGEEEWVVEQVEGAEGAFVCTLVHTQDESALASRRPGITG